MIECWSVIYGDEHVPSNGYLAGHIPCVLDGVRSPVMIFGLRCHSVNLIKDVCA